ncbi:hypothetical protein NC651_017438 [Populus alba x Populus x berolinensis]|nr:hypothetical protein NC651_017438 [Populus alba x Populus x berolinensis]
MCSRVRLLLNSAALVCQTGLRWLWIRDCFNPQLMCIVCLWRSVSEVLVI